MPTPASHNQFRRTLTRRNGQAFVEYFSIIGVVLVALVGAVVAFGDGIMNLFTGAGEQTAPITEQVFDMTPEQEEPPRGRRYGVSTGPSTVGTRPRTLAGAIGSGGGSGGTGGGGGGGTGGGGGGPGGTAGGGGPIPSGPSSPVEFEIAPGVFAHLPTNAERDVIMTVVNMLLRLNLEIEMMNLGTGELVTHTIRDIVAQVFRRGVRILTGDVLSRGAYAEVWYSFNEDFEVMSSPIYMVIDELVLTAATNEVIASIFSHESWHVHQALNGISEDFTNYPRQVDIEYEAFFVEAAVWETIKDGQTAFDDVTQCIASGEAMCKEILATDYGYSTGLRFEEIFGES